MEIFRELEAIENTYPYACVTIGNFDGVHLGHQMLFAEVVQRAYRHHGTSVAITFDPHPLQVLRPEGIKLISTCAQKIELIGHAGIDVLVIVPFTLQFAATSAVHFVDEILKRRIGVKELVVGYDYAFGKGRTGDITFLQKQGREKGFPVTVVNAHYENGMLVSSTKVRELIAEGRMADARRLLGRYYQIRGEVQVGKQRGSKEIGFPTANLHLDPEDLIPKIGVYVSQVICDGKCYGGVLNIGYNPTFGEEKLVAETHIFDFNQDIYGKPIKVNLLQFLRGEQKFSGVQELATQIGRDVVQAKQVLAVQQNELTFSCEEKFNS
ncbi:MAG: bifunctional riboflavin kinase/FAD synthetase [Proteobacteria bacterium]|jgi:riboflavin kinase/FMN adenylyltransferase|nr:bifunctional riboflavin kinase/FAD synthetase [Desulfocapsa sp.]MBU3943757.1 bifunctional riboflavin kinase/FAD synthetase [Pseudomonadota bacterium]MCG2745640.1 bifunctional riboflavin kinase/FAD synthetase [Desulfobacteraceae bacterium]MDO8947769.1 bifunctional riboflavin kinase/FAD synthetase [Desulfocapsaceae bacterium]MBU4029100.1 bifunctional riboflavin kinase/FAD synthetase [Pseudomonadota bacterium]